MSRHRKASKADAPRFEVGSRVRVPMAGDSSFLVEVLEDLGNVGWQGSHILHVRRVSEYPEEREDFDVRAADVIPVD